MALSQVRRIHGRRRTIHSGTTRAPFSTAPGHAWRTSIPLARSIQFAYVPRPPRQLLPSDGFFERDAQHLLSALSIHTGFASEKALASSGSYDGSTEPLLSALHSHPNLFRTVPARCRPLGLQMQGNSRQGSSVGRQAAHDQSSV